MSLNGKIYYGNTLVSNPVSGDITIINNGTYDVGSYENAIVNVGGEIEDAPFNDVNFYDYDGTRLYSYSAADFANLSALPANPTHDGLTAQGWNWTLSAAKTYVSTYGILNIGQNYTTSDGKTRLYLHDASTVKIIYTKASGSTNISVDWGDGTTTSNYSNNTTHNYSTIGDYVVTITVPSGTIIQLGYYMDYLYGNIIGRCLSDGVCDFTLEKVEIGNNVKCLSSSCFAGCGALKSVSIPSTVEYIVSSFYGDSKLKTVVFPQNTLGIGTDNTGNTINYPMFWGCSSLKTVCIHQNYSNMTYDNMFGSNQGTMDFTYNTFYKCASMESIALNSTDATRPYSFCSCYSLTKISLGPTNSVPGYCFCFCQSLESVTIPSTVYSMGNITSGSGGAPVIYNCYLMKKLTMTSNPPALANSNIISNSAPYPDVMKIYIPSALISQYTGATNWSSNTSRFVTY